MYTKKPKLKKQLSENNPCFFNLGFACQTVTILMIERNVVFLQRLAVHESLNKFVPIFRSVFVVF